jgi:hypothetical protein
LASLEGFVAAVTGASRAWGAVSESPGHFDSAAYQRQIEIGFEATSTADSQ